MGILFPSQRLESIEPCGIDLRGPRIRMARALKFPSGVVRPARSRTDEEVRVQTRSRTLSPRSRRCASPKRCGERSAASPRGAVDQPAAACELAAADSSLAIPVEEAYAATKYVAENGSVLNVDGSRLGVLGDSAGGNMAAAVTLLSKQRRRPKIAFQLLFYPVTDANFETGSYTQFQDGPWLTKSAMEWFWNAYLPDKAAAINSRGCPTLSSSPPRTMYSETKVRLTRAGCGRPACASPAPATSARSTISSCSTLSPTHRQRAALLHKPTLR
jgi:hypothetical protein